MNVVRIKVLFTQDCNIKFRRKGNKLLFPFSFLYEKHITVELLVVIPNSKSSLTTENYISTVDRIEIVEQVMGKSYTGLLYTSNFILLEV